jgi:2-oxoglutarate dehydrogenase E1 component
LLGYRKYGHNEGDEPKFTQPQLYKAIAAHPSPRETYLAKLIQDGTVTSEEAEAMKASLVQAMEDGFEEAKSMELSVVDDFLSDLWEAYRPAKDEELTTSPQTGVATKKLVALAERMNSLPEAPNFFRKVKKLMRDRLAMLERDELDWAMGEKLAYATLLDEGHPVRISGQDVERGTFSHRHAVVKTEDSEEKWIMLNELSEGQAKLQVYNSLLSEYAVSGFEYGYSFAQPNGLTIWEAQFGDFNNGAQIMWDQFLTAGEDKWRTMNGLTLLLPHGYEGMGSEHSSGRLERFLQLCSGDNIVVANCTTPANMFHLLRRQVHRPFRKPLVVFTPKKLLRYPKAVSSIQAFSKGGFLEVVDDAQVEDGAEVVVLCSGKVYYDLLEKFVDKAPKNLALVRLEQLHPFPAQAVSDVLSRHGKPKVVWLQEEPRNMGGWTFVREQMDLNGWGDLSYVGREASASPASGSPAVHQQRHDALLDEVVAMAQF